MRSANDPYGSYGDIMAGEREVMQRGRGESNVVRGRSPDPDDGDGQDN
jgi:hypothetical protein